jgi:hypothetical protein
MTRLMLGLAALLACGVIAAGCGDDDDDSSGDDSPVATESEPTATTGDAGSVEEAVQSCKEGVQANAGQLSEDLRGELEDLCDKAASGDEQDLRDATIEACKKVIEETVPEGAGRDQAVAACDNSG